MKPSGGLIAVDLDGTLAEYHGWDEGNIGRPIPYMKKKVEQWLKDDRRVCIFTARVSGNDAHEQEPKIWDWLYDVFGVDLADKIEKITATKTMDIIQIWDDRAVQVVPNAGISITEVLRWMSAKLEAISD